jgi:predicted secreted protein
MSSESIRVPQGESFEVKLREPAAGGYRWALEDAPPGVALIDERYEPPCPGPKGNAGQRIAVVRATDSGTYRLRFVLARPWEARPHAEHCVDVTAY